MNRGSGAVQLHKREPSLRDYVCSFLLLPGAGKRVEGNAQSCSKENLTETAVLASPSDSR